jgi:hypothetical protein
LEYYHFGKVFSKEESQRLSRSHPWDHAIDLIAEAPPKLNCKIYPLTPGQQELLDKFLKEHLAKGYIYILKLPYASPFSSSRRRMASSDLYKTTGSLISLLCRILTLFRSIKSSLIDSSASIGLPSLIFNENTTMFK